MALTKQDLEAIQGIVQNTVVDITAPMFEQVFQRFDALDERMDRFEKTQNKHTELHHSHSQRLTQIETRLDSIEGRIEALEADIKELYLLVEKMEKSQKPKGYDKLSLEKKLITTHSMVMEIAKKYGINLPPH